MAAKCEIWGLWKANIMCADDLEPMAAGYL